jgi:hypothetical protein
MKAPNMSLFPIHYTNRRRRPSDPQVLCYVTNVRGILRLSSQS